MNFANLRTREIFERIHVAIQSNSSVTNGKEGVYQFDLQGEDGGTYQLIIEKDEARIVIGKEKEPQCTFFMEADHFKDMVVGKLNPTVAFMSGKVKVKGDMGLALKLQTLLKSFSR